MKTNSVLRNLRRERKGFALITTVTILVLLSLIAIGLLSLSSVTVRSGSAELAQLEAKANARLALMLAIGELQTHLGPDQRVSAEAGILDQTPETLSIEGVYHPHWTGVWSTEWLGETGDDDNKSPWVRNDREGGLSDRRFEEGYDREREVLS
jgi:type II secretory pathway pseudopilin PulG